MKLYIRFGLFLPNATINVPYFRHKNIFFGLLKMTQIFWGGILTKFWPFWAKYAHFGLFLPYATINVPHFRHRNIFFGLLRNGANKFCGKIWLFGRFWQKKWPFWAKYYAHFSLFLLNAWRFLNKNSSKSLIFWPKNDWKPFDIISFYMKYIELSIFVAC